MQGEQSKVEEPFLQWGGWVPDPALDVRERRGHDQLNIERLLERPDCIFPFWGSLAGRVRDHPLGPARAHRFLLRRATAKAG